MSEPTINLQSERQRFPGLLPREILVLRAWLKINESQYDRFDYNVRLGPGHDPGPQWPQNMRDMAIANTQKRADAVGFQGDQSTIIEVKDRATLSALGQLLGYRTLYTKDNPTAPRPLMILACNRYAADIVEPCMEYAIRLDVVAVDFTVLRGKS